MKQGLQLVRKGVQRVESVSVLREATTGRVVTLPRVSLQLVSRVLPQVRAMAEESAAGPAAAAAGVAEPVAASAAAVPAGLAFYRKYTEALLRRYLRIAMEVGRVPSVMNRDMFRGNVSHYKRTTLEDGVIFCFDVEKQIAQLDAVERELVKRIALQDYSQAEVAGMLGISLRSCVRRYAATLDHLTRLFLAGELLQSMVEPAVTSDYDGNVVKGVKPGQATQVIVIGEVTGRK